MELTLLYIYEEINPFGGLQQTTTDSLLGKTSMPNRHRWILAVLQIRFLSPVGSYDCELLRHMQRLVVSISHLQQVIVY